MTHRIVIITIAVLGLSSGSAALAQPDIYVDKNATGTPDGLSWATAYTELSTALANATAGNELWLADGEYLPGTNSSDTFDLLPGIEIYGGFQGNSHPSGGETSRDERNSDPINQRHRSQRRHRGK